MNQMNTGVLQALFESSYGNGLSALGAPQANPLNRLDIRQAGAYNPIAAQQAALQAGQSTQALAAMQNYWVNHPQSKLNRAQRMAQEVREKNPGMQVQRRTRREA